MADSWHGTPIGSLCPVRCAPIIRWQTKSAGQDRAVLQIEWIERAGPKCIPVSRIRRALLSGSDEVDFILINRARIRAKFDEDCPALDFYGGFYLQPEDDRLCAKRDAIHSRMGGSCTIEKFKQLVPRARR